MLCCKRTAKLLSKGLDEKLPWFKRVLLHSHLAFCKGCKHSARQLVEIREVMCKYLTVFCSEQMQTPQKMSSDAKTRIQACLKNASSEQNPLNSSQMNLNKPQSPSEPQS